ncbi:MAG: hypothetical protein D6675_01630 [Gemmatimonadetes bacterium]|nr:MAG: hypothetical protein D6675_01630 [Gemmatimonadota bacterium]
MNIWSWSGITLLLLITSCTPPPRPPSPHITRDNPLLYQEIAQRRFLGQAEYRFNPTKTHVMVIRRGKTRPFTPKYAQPLEFFIFDLAEQRIVYEDQQANGKVTWVTPHQIKVTLFPETMQGIENEPYGYLYDVQTQQKTVLSQ